MAKGQNSVKRLHRIKIDAERKREAMKSKYILTSGPDRGYAWVVCAACTAIQVFVDAIPLTYGIILEIISKHFGVSMTTGSMVGSTIYGVHYLSAPMACGLTNLLGAK